MKHLFKIIYLLFFPLSLGLISCRHSHEQDVDPVYSKKMLVSASYNAQWQFPEENGTDWEHYPAWDSIFHFPYELLNPRVPEGLRVQVYINDHQHRIFNLSSKGGEVPFTNGEQSLLLFNNNTEYIVFDELQSLKSAMVTTRSRSKNEETMNAPDMLFAHYIESYRGDEHPDVEALSVVLQPIVYSYLLQFEFSKGLERVVKASGALTGMASSVSLTDKQTSSTTATIPFATNVYDCAIQGLVRSFGIPDYPRKGNTTPSQGHTLQLELKLNNGKIQRFEFDVTNQLVHQPRGGVIRIQHIVVDEKKDSNPNNSGFDVDVNDWGESEIIPLPI